MINDCETHYMSACTGLSPLNSYSAPGILKIFSDPVNKQKVRKPDNFESRTMNPGLSREARHSYLTTTRLQQGLTQ